MKIYLAARYARRPELLKYAKQIEAIGHEVTSRWVRGSHAADTEDELAREAARFAKEDIEDIKTSQVLIAFTEQPATEGSSRGGRHVELGYALAMDKRIIVVGPLENVFCHLPKVLRYDSWRDFEERWLAGSMKYRRKR